MGYREPTPGGLKGPDNLPLLVLPEGTVLHQHYRIERFLAAGGMSLVYLARKGEDQLILKEVSGQESRGVISLNQEKATLDRLDHPHIARCQELFEEDGFYYLVLEYVEGQSLEKLVSPFPDTFLQEEVVRDWALQLCDIFEYLHARQPPIIYRDLKPKNVIKDPGGRIHLVDFGIARTFKGQKSRDTDLMGSALTASPEHYGVGQTDVRSDIFTLGATLHFLLTNGGGRADEPFRFEPVRRVNPAISANLDRVVAKAVSLKPVDRYPSVRAMRQALLNTRREPLPVLEPYGDRAGEQGLEATVPLPAYPSPRMVSTWTIVVAALFMLGFGWLLAHLGQRTPAVVSTPSPVAVLATPAAPPLTLPEEPVETLSPAPMESPRPTPSARPTPTRPPPAASPTAAPVAPRPSPTPKVLPTRTYPKATPRPTSQPTSAPTPQPSPPPFIGQTPPRPGMGHPRGPGNLTLGPVEGRPVPGGTLTMGPDGTTVVVPSGYLQVTSLRNREAFIFVNDGPPPRQLKVQRLPRPALGKDPLQAMLHRLQGKGATNVRYRETSLNGSPAWLFEYESREPPIPQILGLSRVYVVKSPGPYYQVSARADVEVFKSLEGEFRVFLESFRLR